MVLLREDFKGTKAILESIPGKKSLSSLIVPAGTLTKKTLSENKADKPVSEWDLTDYRKFAPNELKNNPRLYRDLIEQSKNNTNI